MKRVAITGMGAVTPIGLTFPESWNALLEGRSGLAPITRFDASALKWQHAGELKGFKPLEHASKKDTLRFDPFVLYALAAAKEALSNSGLNKEQLETAAMVLGSGRGGISTLEQAAQTHPTAFTMAGSTVSMAASLAGASLGIKGPVAGLSCACASGTVAIGTAFEMVRSGRVEVAFTGGAEAPICPLCVKGYGRSGALSKSGIVKPFAPGRDGFVLGEGAAVLVLEEMAHARKRGARIYAELAGYGNTSDTGHPTQPDPEGEARAMQSAISDAGLDTSDIDLIMAHATGTVLGDAAEARAISDVFGPDIKGAPAVCTVKPATGHMLAASGAIEAAAAARAISEGIIPPFSNAGNAANSANSANSDSSLLLPAEATRSTVKAALCNSFGFGGVNTALVLIAAPDTI